MQKVREIAFLELVAFCLVTHAMSSASSITNVPRLGFRTSHAGFAATHTIAPIAPLLWSTKVGLLYGTLVSYVGVSYSLAEEPSEMATQLYTTPAAGSSMLSRFKRRVTVVRANQIPDAMAQAEAIEAVMPSADMPGIPSASLSLIHQVPSATVQKQQQQQDQQAGQDLLTTPEEPKSKQKKAKSEAKKLKKRAQEATAVNEKQSKLQRQSDAPVLAPEALQVSVGPEVKSQAAVLQEDVVATASDDKKHKKGKKDKKDKKLSSVKKRKQKDASSV